MSMPITGGSAKIIPFPVGGRAHAGFADKDRKEFEPSPDLDIVWGDDWYHQAAIREAELVGKS